VHPCAGEIARFEIAAVGELAAAGAGRDNEHRDEDRRDQQRGRGAHPGL
jgi:hypothetical protein